MNNINEDFNIPYYIFEEITEYLKQTAEGKCKCMKWENIKTLLKCAKLNNRFTQEQVEFLIKKYNRENI